MLIIFKGAMCDLEAINFDSCSPPFVSQLQYAADPNAWLDPLIYIVHPLFPNYSMLQIQMLDLAP